MKKILLLLCTLLGTVGAMAETITWESKSGWTQASGGYANVYWFGAQTPGSATTDFTMSSFQIMQQTTGNDNYIAIATATSTSTLSESNVVAVSNNHLAPSSSTATLETYTFDTEVTLKGGTNYYIVFLSSNVATDGAYPVRQGRISLNHTGYGTYAPGCSNASPSTWWPYFKATLTSAVTMINVTYELYESDGTTLVNSEVTSQEPNSAVSIPSAFSSNTYYNYVTEGTIGSEACTIKVIRTLKSQYVYPIANLSNSKVYTISCERGDFSTYNGNLASTSKTELGVSAKNFAIISYNDNYYLYSIDDSKYVQTNGTLNTYPTDAVLTIESTSTVPLFRFIYGTNWVNTTSGGTYGLKIDDWKKEDGGNMYSIEEVGDFSDDALAAALAAFTDRTPYFESLAAVIATADAMTFGTGAGQYVKGADYDVAYSTATTTYANTDATIDELETAALNLATAINNCTIASINGKFIRLKNTSISGYSYVGTAASGKAPLVADVADAGIYYVTSDNKIVSYNQGKYLSTYAGAQCTVSNEATFTIADGGNGTYTFYYGGTGYLIAWTSGYTDRLSSVSDYARFTVEEVTELPVTISAAGYATLYAPVALNYPSAVVVNTVTINVDGVHLDLAEVTGGAIPAETPVLLSGDAGTYNFEVTDDAPAINAVNILVGTTTPFAALDGCYILQNQSGKVGFYEVDTEYLTANEMATPNVPGFRAYIPAQDNPVKAFYFGEADGIQNVDANLNVNEGAIFNIAGQRVAKAQKGLYIMNSKKVLVK